MTNIIKQDFQGYGVSFNNDGWINATEAAKRFNKRPVDWLALPTTKSYLFVLAKALNINPDVRKSHFGLVRAVKGGNNKNNQGTWLHPKLAVAFARWLSDEFAVWCDITIDNLIRSKTVIYTNEQIIKLLTLEEADTWEKRFIDSFYRALARVTNTRYLGHNKGTPIVFAKITKEWVYEVVLPDYVYQSAKARCSKGEKVHQYLTPTALKAVEAQILSITSLANGCLDYQDFISRCTQAYTKQGQIKLILPKAS